MALPAGRYGVTKNQLLKIKKLPMNTIKLIEELTEKFDLLGTAAFKNSTSVVTQSTDLVESGAVKDIVGWGNKNLGNYNGENNVVIAQVKSGVTYTFSLTSTGHGGVNLKKNDNSGDVVAVITVTSEGRNSVTFTADSDFNLFMNGYGRGGIGFADDISDLQLEVGSTATAYEPYHASVEESKCDNSTIAHTENGTTASQAYAVGSHFIRNGAFCTVTTAITSGESLVGSNKFTSGDVADLLTSIMSQLGTLKYKFINTGTYVGMLTTDIFTDNQFFALVVILTGNDIIFAYCGRRFSAGTFVTSDNTKLRVSENGYLQVLSKADSDRYHIIYAQN